MSSDNVAEVEELSTAMSSSELPKALDVLATLQATVKKQVLGRDDVIELAIIALIADGHVLLEDFPGSGKTTLAKALGEAIINGSSNDESIVPFRRIQFTPDLLPSDVTGVPVFDSNSNAFHFRHGPLFAHVVLADEINRTSPKVQSAMLEAMGEKQVTVDNVTYALDDLFFVIATQNPLDLVGTYPLPTPQLDRFLFKITMDHIDRDSELDVLDTYKTRRDLSGQLETVTRDQVLRARKTIDNEVAIGASVKTALVDISRNLRDDDRVLQGNSTRSMVLLLPALQVSAALRGRDFVSAEDIELLLPRVLGHRIELAPGVSDVEKVLLDNMREPMEQLARSTLSK
ncbi:MAG: AAA family ATPase [Gammaproteobacteria bacterium]|nr:AAA family ATPase [Gammaproteobacteria bacterium]MDD9895174.1 AAA family ATPase [Gammaproteobacteria bacterium]MDD9960165.1 AAA family ATPase [Gammaproteobacteria bacterium]